MTDFDTIQRTLETIDSKQDLQSEKLTRLECHVERNADGLNEHMKQTKLLKSYVDNQNKIISQRVEKIEAPKLVLKTIGKWVVTLGSIGFACIGVFKALEMFGIL